jgi:hypothetical protein
MKLELERWEDGSLRLVYWDFVHGEDVIYILLQNDSGEWGANWRVGEEDGMEEIVAISNLPHALAKLYSKVAEVTNGEDSCCGMRPVASSWRVER